MEGKNLILAICLSALVLIFWSIFFAQPPPTIDEQENRIEKIQKDEDSKISSPSLETTAKTKMMSRVDSLKETKRISLENNNIVGSISLTGGILDDITLKNYNERDEENKAQIYIDFNLFAF